MWDLVKKLKNSKPEGNTIGTLWALVINPYPWEAAFGVVLCKEVPIEVATAHKDGIRLVTADIRCKEINYTSITGYLNQIRPWQGTGYWSGFFETKGAALTAYTKLLARWAVKMQNTAQRDLSALSDSK